MKVSELANQLNITSADVLEVLKSFKLKAKDSNQDLSDGVISVIKSELTKRFKSAQQAKVKAEDAKVPKKAAVAAKKAADPENKIKAKKAVKKSSIPKSASKKKVPEKLKAGEAGAEAPQKKVRKVISTPVKSKADGSTVKKRKTVSKVSLKEPGKSFPKISNAPVFTLKPLPRKRKKPARGESGTAEGEKTDEAKMLLSSKPDAEVIADRKSVV